MMAGSAYGQGRPDLRRDTLLQSPAAYNAHAGKFPNFYQNNSMYSNNSMQYNAPPNPKAGPFTGNGDFSDPSKNIPPATLNNTNVPTIYTPATWNTPK
jgi:hypothetical protein